MLCIPLLTASSVVRIDKHKLDPELVYVDSIAYRDDELCQRRLPGVAAPTLGRVETLRQNCDGEIRTP